MAAAPKPSTAPPVEGVTLELAMTDHDVPMPEDWNDHAGWEAYHAAQVAQVGAERWGDRLGTIRLTDLPGLADSMATNRQRDVWVPGCGLSPLPHLLAHLGLQVAATDIAPAAIRFQGEPGGAFEGLKERLGPARPGGALVAELHDFRAEYRREAFDLILNVKAIQGFSPPDLARIAASHAGALRKNRVAYFDTMNVQGALRDRLEGALEEAGFVVPFAALNRWYRAKLRETGIPHAFILGRPLVVAARGPEGAGRSMAEDSARLREIEDEYDARVKVELGAEQARLGPETKQASIIYSTG